MVQYVPSVKSSANSEPNLNRKNVSTRKGKEEYIGLYSAIYTTHSLKERSDMDHTVLSANYTM